MKVIDTDKLQKELSKLSDEKLAKFMMLLPCRPDKQIKNFTSFYDFFGGGQTRNQFISYDEARDQVRHLKLKTYEDWREYVKSGKKPYNIPADPEAYYKRTKEWIHMAHFLSNDKGVHNQDRYSYNEAKTYIQNLGLKTQPDVKNWMRNNIVPYEIPRNIPQYYTKTQEWEGWGKFLGTDYSTTSVVIQYSLEGKKLNKFNSLSDAATRNKIKSTSGISSCCSGKIKSASGCVWRYEDDPFDKYLSIKQTSGRKQQIFIKEKDILNYLNGQVSSYELAKKYHCNYKTINNHIKNYKKEYNIK